MPCKHGIYEEYGKRCNRCMRELMWVGRTPSGEAMSPPGPFSTLRESVYRAKREIKAGETIIYVLLGDGRIISDDISEIENESR